VSICVADLRWFIQHLWLAYIACMDEQFGALEGLDDFGTQQPMSIRNDANDAGLVHALGSLRMTTTAKHQLRLESGSKARYGTSRTR
jgi:hypothetical protein